MSFEDFDVNGNTDSIKIGCVDNPRARVLRIVHISDTHLRHENLTIPMGDVLVHSGDFFNFYDGVDEIKQSTKYLNAFFESQPHTYKIFVAGNHEMCLADAAMDKIKSYLPSVIYLQDSSVTIEGLSFYGSPWSGKRKSPTTAFTMAFPELGKYWMMIPHETDVLITHSPPHRILDYNGMLGCPLLREIVLKQVRPLLHLFGHAHVKGSGVMEKEGVVFSNAAMYGHDLKANVYDIYIPPERPNKTKLYKAVTWREEDPKVTSPKPENNNPRKFPCLIC